MPHPGQLLVFTIPPFDVLEKKSKPLTYITTLQACSHKLFWDRGGLANQGQLGTNNFHDLCTFSPIHQKSQSVL